MNENSAGDGNGVVASWCRRKACGTGRVPGLPGDSSLRAHTAGRTREGAGKRRCGGSVPGAGLSQRRDCHWPLPFRRVL